MAVPELVQSLNLQGNVSTDRPIEVCCHITRRRPGMAHLSRFLLSRRATSLPILAPPHLKNEDASYRSASSN
jgi:hypothetical protein